MFDVTPDNLEATPEYVTIANQPPKYKHSPVDPVDDAMTFDELRATLEHHGDVVTRIQQMLPQVAPENALLQDPRLLQTTSGRTIQNKTSKKRNQLAVFPQYGLNWT